MNPKTTTTTQYLLIYVAWPGTSPLLYPIPFPLSFPLLLFSDINLLISSRKYAPGMSIMVSREANPQIAERADFNYCSYDIWLAHVWRYTAAYVLSSLSLPLSPPLFYLFIIFCQFFNFISKQLHSPAPV